MIQKISIFHLFLVLFLSINKYLCQCPQEIISPCKCDDIDQISCDSLDLDLDKYFDNLSNSLTDDQKHFNQFLLRKTNVTQISENAFKDITFDKILIHENNDLISIHKNTFTTNNLIVKKISFYLNSKLSSPDNSIYEVLSKLINVEEIELAWNNITEIPSNAFTPTFGDQSKLTQLRFIGTPISKISGEPFAKLRNLNSLFIAATDIDYIPENTFTFNTPSNTTLLLTFENGKISGSSFTLNSLSNIRRPTKLVLNYLRFDFFNESVFKPFLLSNDRNSIQLTNFKIDCNNCDNLWIKTDTNLSKKILGVQCSNNKQFNDPDNFKDCHTIDSMIKPCVYKKEHDELYCGGGQELNLENIFTSLSDNLKDYQKHFKLFILSNEFITELKENTFKDITFDVITIEMCRNLLTINRNAFTATNSKTKQLIIRRNPELISPDHLIFESLSKFVNIEYIYLALNNITEIPSNAFKPLEGYQNKLSQLTLLNFKKLGSDAFADLNNLSSLSLIDSHLETIPSNAFRFHKNSSNRLFIHLSYNDLVYSSFQNNSLANINRPTTLILDGCLKLTGLPETEFLEFLSSSENNVELSHDSMDCNNCLNVWFKKYSNLLPRLHKLKCSDGKDVNDPDHFIKCNN